MTNRSLWLACFCVVAGIFALNRTAAEVPDSPELSDAEHAVAPIEHKPMFQGERELFGYAPRFEPGTVAFDLDHTPYIRDGDVIQTADNTGRWTRLTIAPAISRYFHDRGIAAQFDVVGGQFVDLRVVFDERGDAYTLAKVKRADRTWLLLLHSRDRCATWDVYPLPPLEHARLEFRDGHNTMTHPPALLVFKEPYLGVITPQRAEDGSLILHRAVTVSEESLLVPNHSGGGNSVITLDDHVYVVYPSTVPHPDKEGTSQFVVAISRDTGHILSGPTLLGTVGVGKPDPHYLPAITADSRGVLHVVLGAHHDSLYYVHSAKPRDASQWTAPHLIGKRRDPSDGGQTYPSLLCDPSDRLHVVSRWAGDGYYFRLSYIRGDAITGRWDPQKVLVRPFRNMYSNWYHHLSLDRKGRLFLNYSYYASQLNAEESRLYRQKWPEDGMPKDAAPGSFQASAKPHDAAMLLSGDGGDSWRLTTTDDLLRR